MPAVAPVPPETLKAILEAIGFHVDREDQYNWTLVRGELEPPIILPKLGPLVALAVAACPEFLTLKSKFAAPVQ